MKKMILAACSATLLSTTAVIGQTTAPTAPPANTPSVTPAPAPPTLAPVTLTDQQAKDWIDKPVYSSDNKKLGEVAAFARDARGTVTEMHADTGGFLGFGETRLRIMPSQFKLLTDRVVLAVTAEDAKTLPKIIK